MTSRISASAAAARESARAGDGKFGVQPVSETVGVDLTESVPVPSLTATGQPHEWDAQRTATHLGVEDFDEVVDFVFENEPDDTGANAAIDDELVEPHVLLHHLTRGDRVGSYKSDGDEYLVTTLVPGSGSVPEVEKAQVVSEAGATAAFNNEIDEFERKQRR